MATATPTATRTAGAVYPPIKKEWSTVNVENFGPYSRRTRQRSRGSSGPTRPPSGCARAVGLATGRTAAIGRNPA